MVVIGRVVDDRRLSTDTEETVNVHSVLHGKRLPLRAIPELDPRNLTPICETSRVIITNQTSTKRKTTVFEDYQHLVHLKCALRGGKGRVRVACAIGWGAWAGVRVGSRPVTSMESMLCHRV